MIEYIILGTSHEHQHSPRFAPCVQGAIQTHAVRLIAEEWPQDAPSPAFILALHLHIPYLQIDMFPDEQVRAGIFQELSRRPAPVRKGGEGIELVCYRLPHADAVREGFWLDKMEASIERGRVLVICGFHHVSFLTEKAKARGCQVIEKMFFPPELPHGVEIRALSPAELDEYWRGRDTPS